MPSPTEELPAAMGPSAVARVGMVRRALRLEQAIGLFTGLIALFIRFT